MSGLRQRDGIGARIPLDQFLQSLDPETGAELRAVAARIDAFSRTAEALSGVEQRLLPWAGGAAVLFLIGLWLLIHVDASLALPTALSMGALPLVAARYAWLIKPRTQADNAAQDLNRTHFLPHGGLYFPPGEGPACVVQVDWSPPPEPEPTPPGLRDPRKPENRIGSSW